MAAGGQTPWNVWGNVASNDTRQAYTVGTTAIRNDVDVLNTVIGADYGLTPRLAVGLSAAWDRGDGTTQSGGSTDIKGYALAPYLGYQLSKELALDASFGWGTGKVTSGGTTESKSDRQFYAANLAYSNWIKNIQLTGKLSYLHGEEKFGNTTVSGATINNTASKNKMDRWQLAGQAGYWVGNGVMPYVSLAYSNDDISTSLVGGGNDKIGKNALQWTLGVNYFSSANGVTGGIAYMQEEGRTNQKNNVLAANISIRF